MKKIKQIIGTFLLAFFMIVNFDIVQAIAPPRLDDTNLGTLDTEQAIITITNVNEGDELSAYKILDIYRNSVTNEINYRYTDSFYAFLETGGFSGTADYSALTEEEYLKLTSGDITSGSTQTNSTLDVLVSEYAKYIYKNNILGAQMSNSGTTASLTTNTGSYLVLPMKTNKLYAVMVGNLDYKEVNGEWVKQNSTIVAKASDPSIKASIGKIGQKKASFSIGEEYTYFMEVTVPPYPTNSWNNGFYLGMFFGNGLTPGDFNTITVMDGDKKLNVVIENSTFEGVDCVGLILDESGNTVGGIITQLGDFSGLIFGFYNSFLDSNYLTVSFKSELNNQAKVCYKELTNTNITFDNFNLGDNDTLALLGYGYAYKEYGNINAETISDLVKDNLSSYDFTHAYTYKAQINKHVLGDSNKKLGGAVFEIYSDSALSKKVGTVTTDENGFAEFSGLGEGKYYLKEVTAPTGYSLLKLPTEIEIKYDESLVDSETGEYCGPVVDIANQKVSALPITGGMGTIIFTLVGILLIGSAGIGITYYKKKNKNLV